MIKFNFVITTMIISLVIILVFLLFELYYWDIMKSFKSNTKKYNRIFHSFSIFSLFLLTGTNIILSAYLLDNPPTNEKIIIK